MRNKWPAVVLSLFNTINLIPSSWTIKHRWPMLCFVQPACLWLPSKPLRISMSIRPYRTSRKRIVLWNTSICIYTQCFSSKILYILSNIFISSISSCYVQLSVWAKLHTRSRMILCCRNIIDHNKGIFKSFPCISKTHNLDYKITALHIR